MIKFVIPAFAAVIAIAGAASAAEQPSAVHISLDGKSAAEVRSEVLSASQKVCDDADFECVNETFSDAMLQYRHMSRYAAEEAKLAMERDAGATVRVSVTQKSPAPAPAAN
jgi:hypothetical protein